MICFDKPIKNRTMIKLLIIEDEEETVNIVKEEALKLAIETFTFVPISREKDQVNEQLSGLCKETKFDFALLDFELWSGLKGYDLAGTLVNSEVKFVAFSSSHEKNSMLVKCGAVSSIQKDYNSRGLDKQKIINGLRELLRLLDLGS